jgi:hypothetical protein
MHPCINEAYEKDMQKIFNNINNAVLNYKQINDSENIQINN